MKRKLVLANNQSKKFVSFHTELQNDEQLYDYAGYKSLLFHFYSDGSEKKLSFLNVDTNAASSDFSGVYINGYMHVPELAATVATVLDANDIPYVNRELQNAPSLSKLTAYAKLAARGVSIPDTLAGSAYALIAHVIAKTEKTEFPAILKRADADRGIDNYKVYSNQDVLDILTDQDPLSIWVLQEYVPNDGFYLVSFYNSKPVFSIFRSLEERPDGDSTRAHMFKPKGGVNASLLEIADVPSAIVATSQKAIEAMNRQIASVDSIYDPVTDRVYVLEVNYNPQLVTIETFKEIRQEAFLEAIKNI